MALKIDGYVLLSPNARDQVRVLGLYNSGSLRRDGWYRIDLPFSEAKALADMISQSGYAAFAYSTTD